MSESGWQRKHGRLESFLQRLLATEASRVTWYEPCIVDGGPAKKPSFSFVVLTDGQMYIVDNPPRQVRAVVLLCDVVDMQVVHESPMFLKGEDRENAQHIKLLFKMRPRVYTESVLRSLSRFPTGPSRVGSRPSSVLSEALSVSSDHSPSNEIERKQRRLRKFLSSLAWPKKKTTIHHGTRLGNNMEPVRSTSSWDFAETNSMTSSITPDVHSISSSRLSFRSLWPFSRNVDGRALTPDPGVESLDPRVMSTPQTLVQRTVSAFLNVDAPQDWIRCNRPMSTMPDGVLMDTSSLASSSIMSEMSIRSEPLVRSRTVLGNYADHRSRSSTAMLRSISDTTDEESTFLTESNEKSMHTDTVLHLYILTPQSGFFRHLKSAWNHCLMKYTLDLDVNRSQPIRNDSREHFEQVLQDLHRKLCLKSDDNFIQIRQLVDRIQKDVAHSYVAKKIFWKDPHIFPAMVNKLHALVTAQNCFEEHTIGYIMDKIKACTSLVHILASVLQETEVCPGRARHLTYRNGQRTKDLLTTLVTMPWIPPAYRDITVAAVTCYDNFASREWEHLMEAPLIRSVAELTNNTTMALYQYFQLALEGHELTSSQTLYGIGWMVKIISEVKSVDTFISRLMCQLLLLTSPTDHCPLTPKQAVLLHQQVSVMSILVSHSPAVALRVTIMYGEEIRYFVLRQVVGKKVLSNYPIRTSLLSMVDTFREAILGKRTASATHLYSVGNSVW